MTGVAAPVVVFLHIPKTAGQTVHAGLSRAIGATATSPVRVHTQAAPGAAQLPPGFRLYSGHIDWDALETLPADRFVFTVLRDPYERIASFYFYLRQKAAALSDADLALPAHTGLRMIRQHSAAGYFFGGDPDWQTFVRDHYDNVCSTYLATRRIRGWQAVADLPAETLLEQALTGAKALNRVYSVADLGALEADLAQLLGQPVQIAGRHVNAGPQAAGSRRWPALAALLGAGDAARLARYADTDRRLLDRLGLATGVRTAAGLG